MTMTSPNLLSPELEAMIEDAFRCSLHCRFDASGFHDIDCRGYERPVVRTLVRRVVERCAEASERGIELCVRPRDITALIRALAQPKGTKP